MRTFNFLTGVALIVLSSTPIHAIQIGPEIRIGGGEFTIGGVGVKDGKAAVPTATQLLDTAINSTPLTLLSDADKQNVKQAIVTTGVIAAVASDPIAGLIIVSILAGDNGKRQDIAIPVSDASPTGKTWTLAASCIVQQTGGVITAFFLTNLPELSTIADGDTVQLTAPFCPEYKQLSVTVIRIKKTGLTNIPGAADGKIHNVLVGRPV